MSNSKCADVMRTFCYVFADPDKNRGSHFFVVNNYQTHRDKDKIVEMVSRMAMKLKSTHGDFMMYKSHLPHIAGIDLGKMNPELGMVLDCNDNTYELFDSCDMPGLHF
jgi:hypothetical protein